jgi:DNA-binding NtrC family response regulator
MIRLSALPEALRIGGNTLKQPKEMSPKEASLTPDASQLPFKDAKDQLIQAFERQYLVDLIELHGGNVTRAARAADMDRKSITRLLKKHEIR